MSHRGSLTQQAFRADTLRAQLKRHPLELSPERRWISVEGIPLDFLLHPRVLKHCASLFSGEHYGHAALEAFIQVERAIREKLGLEAISVGLVSHAFGEGARVKLRVRFGDEHQARARAFLKGAFSYYRNYAAHDGAQFDSASALRAMVVASDLLELIGASEVSFEDVGGVHGLVKQGLFSDLDHLRRLLRLLDGHLIADDVWDGFWESLAMQGYGERELAATIQTGLVEYLSVPVSVTTGGLDPEDQPEAMGEWSLTPVGRRLLEEGNPKV